MQFQVAEHSTYAYTGARAFDPDLPSVVFVHGAGLDHTVWILQSRWFAHHGYNALAVDLPGHGRSAGTPPASIEDAGRWVVDCIDALGLPRAAVVGHSMGALVTLEAAAAAPQRVVFAGLLGIAVPMPVSDALLTAARDDLPAACRMITLWGHGFPAQVGGNQAPGMWMTSSALRLLARSRPGVLHNDLNACNAYLTGLERASKVACPALVLLGRQDVMASPRGVRPLMEALPDARLLELDPCGHMMMAEQPDAVLDALAQAMGGAPGLRAA